MADEKSQQDAQAAPTNATPAKGDADPEVAPSRTNLDDVESSLADVENFAKRARLFIGGLRELYGNFRGGFAKGVRWFFPDSLKSLETGLTTIRNIIANFAILILVVAMLVLVWRETTSTAIQIESIEVKDPVLIKRGLTGWVLAVKLREQMNEIENRAWTSMESDDVGLVLKEEEKLPNIEIPGTGLRFADVVAFAKAFAGGRAAQITGEASTIGDQLQITLLSSGGWPIIAAKSLADADSLLHEVAKSVMRNHKPVLYAFYLDSLSRQEPSVEQKSAMQREIVDVIQQAVGAGDLSDEERARIFNLWGIVLTDQKRFDEAIEKFDLALEKAWYERLLRSDRGWYASIMKARAFSNWDRHDNAVAVIREFTEDHPDKTDLGREALKTAHHNWAVWSHANCPGSSPDCEPAEQDKRALAKALVNIGNNALDVAFREDEEPATRKTMLKTALQAALLALDWEAETAVRDDACGLLLDTIDEQEEQIEQEEQEESNVFKDERTLAAQEECE